MTGVTETTLIDRALADALEDITDVTGVFDQVAPVDQAYPFVVYQFQSSVDVVGVGPSARIHSDIEYVVKAVAQVDTYESLSSIAKEIDDRLDGLVYSDSDGLVLSCVRLGEYRLSEQSEGAQIRNLGGRYKFQAQAA